MKVLLKKFGRMLKEHSVAAQKATILLFVMMLFSVITGIVGAYLYEPASKIYIAEDAFHKESRAIYDNPADSEERAMQVAKADESEKVYAEVMDKYLNDSNTLIAKYAAIHSNFVRTLVAILVILPFASIVIMFIGGPVNFLFALANIVLVAPVKAIIFLFNSFRPEEKTTRSKRQKRLAATNKKPSRHELIKEA